MGKLAKLVRDPWRFMFDRRCKQLIGQGLRLARRDAKPGEMFRAYLAAQELVAVLDERPGGETLRLLDIGGGHGIHARYFRAALPELEVDVVDVNEREEPLAFCGDYLDYAPTAGYDAIWASHVLEHVPNPGQFLTKIRADLVPGGWAVITVPPLKHDVHLGHLTLWNAGTLLINLLQAGFDCRDVRLASYGYNISALVPAPIDGQPVAKLKKYLPPLPWRGYSFDGQIPFLNWQTTELEPGVLDARSTGLADVLEHLSRNPPAQPVFFRARYLGRDLIRYYDPKLRCVMDAE